MQVLDTDGKVVPHVYCIGDANGKLMLAHAASAQGISAVENMVGREHVLNHLSVPAACFTHPEVSLRGETHCELISQSLNQMYCTAIYQPFFGMNEMRSGPTIDEPTFTAGTVFSSCGA